MKVRLIGQKAMNYVVSGIDEVKDAVDSEAREIGRRAEARLASHRETGNAHIDVNTRGKDALVSLVDRAALSIEFGHYVVNQHGPTGKYVPGLYIVTGAAGLA